jgi:tripartite-type tricarboxylate transporter receptor subunit TctC
VPKLAAVAMAGGMLFAASPAAADAVQDFYKGKTITVVVSTGAGGPVDLAARMLIKHWMRHIPGNPAMIVKNMPGGGHVLASNFMFNQAPKDGTTIGTVVNSIPLHQAINGQGVRFDARRFGWIGTTGVANLMTVVWHTSPVKTIADVMRLELPTGATGVGAGAFVYPNAMNLILGTKFKMVLGYPSGIEIDLAMERGEVAARGGFSLSGIRQERPDWLSQKKVNVIVQIGSERDKDFPDVPLMHELATTTEQRQVLGLISSPVALGRPFFAPPDIPADRLAALRRAFDATMTDERYRAEAAQLKIDLVSLTGERMTEIVNATIDAPADAVARAKALLETPESKQGN